jgi:hypothetical protein
MICAYTNTVDFGKAIAGAAAPRNAGSLSTKKSKTSGYGTTHKPEVLYYAAG